MEHKVEAIREPFRSPTGPAGPYCMSDWSTNVLTLPACNVYILYSCIIAGVLSMFYMRPKDVCLISGQGSVSGNIVPWKVFPNTLPREQRVYWIIRSLNIMLFNIIPVASEYQEIHPNSVVNIDNIDSVTWIKFDNNMARAN